MKAIKTTLAASALVFASLMATTALAAEMIVAPGQACPAGTAPSTPAYEKIDGDWTLVGWVCESIFTGN